jgi:hypothetical protein
VPERKRVSLLGTIDNGTGTHKTIADLDIQQWVQEHYGFVPHPYWISNSRELFLRSLEPTPESRRPWHECPEEKRLAIVEAFVHFGLLPE